MSGPVTWVVGTTLDSQWHEEVMSQLYLFTFSVQLYSLKLTMEGSGVPRSMCCMRSKSTTCVRPWLVTRFRDYFIADTNRQTDIHTNIMSPAGEKLPPELKKNCSQYWFTIRKLCFWETNWCGKNVPDTDAPFCPN